MWVSVEKEHKTKPNHDERVKLRIYFYGCYMKLEHKEFQEKFLEAMP